ncbi:MAG: hypothetical protein ABI688_10105 [Bacteroidota bacterium]
MKKPVIILLMICSCIWSSVAAQKKWKFSSQNYAGILEGESGTGFQLQTINGFRYKTWFTGIGTGLDYYYQRSVPLFVSVSKFLPPGKLPLYFSGDAGINFPWIKNGIYFQDPGSYSSSLYWAGGIGYKFGSRKRNDAVLLNFGYSFKHLINETEYTNPCLVPPCPVFTDRYDYRLRRVSVKLGWMF